MLLTAGSAESFLIEEFHQSRGFVLELMVVIILLIELAYLVRGKTWQPGCAFILDRGRAREEHHYWCVSACTIRIFRDAERSAYWSARKKK